jgi:conjugal transfer/entry exclusion protein
MWYSKITKDLSEIPNFISYYEKELENHKKFVGINGNLEQNMARLPGQTETVFNSLQEIEAILNFMNIQLRKIKQTHYKQYLEGYNRALTSRDAEKYSDSESSVIEYELLINEVARIRNLYLGIMKGLETKSFMVGHITRIRAAGLENISI